MIFGVLSAIALGIGITGTAHDLINQDAVAPQGEPVIQVQEVRQDTGADDGESSIGLAEKDSSGKQ